MGKRDIERAPDSGAPAFSQSIHAVRDAGEVPDAHETTRPTQRSALIGRDREVEAVCALLERIDIALVTLTGPGGIGKTQLAVAVANRLESQFASAWFVDLSPVRDPAQVPGVIARTLGLREADGDHLRAFLAGRRILLVLDNFEQVVDAASTVAHLLDACPDLSVLVTSRIPLRLSMEHRYPVPPLTAPDPLALPSLAAIRDAAAVRLFSRKAQSVQPGFELTEGNASAVAAICTRLDGLPLAIELAAARSNVLSPPALLARLDHALPLLADGPRDAPPRLRSMRDAIRWSYELLDESEQQLFRRLAVFAGGFTGDAAAAVGFPAAKAESAVLDPLTSLLEKSLIVAASDSDGKPRFTMLETIREFGLEQLVARNEEFHARQVHARHFADRADRTWNMAVGNADESAFVTFQPELPNVRAALAWALDHEPILALRIAGALGYFWIMYGSVTEGFHWATRALAAAPEGPPDLVARAFLAAGWTLTHRGEFARSKPYLSEAVERARPLPKAGLVLGNALACLGNAMLFTEDIAQAKRIQDEEMRVAQALENPLFIAVAYLNQGHIALAEENLVQARISYDAALDLHRQINSQSGMGSAHALLGAICWRMQDEDRASAHFAKAARHFANVGDWFNVTRSIEAFAWTLVAGQPLTGTRLLGAANAARERLSLPRDPWDLAAYETGFATARAALGQPGFIAARDGGRTLSLDDALAIVEQAAHSSGPDAPDSRAARLGITPREQEVLCLLAEGRTDQEIADALFLSRRTVNTHVSRLLAKLGVPNRRRAIALAREQELLNGCPTARYSGASGP